MIIPADSPMEEYKEVVESGFHVSVLVPTPGVAGNIFAWGDSHTNKGGDVNYISYY